VLGGTAPGLLIEGLAKNQAPTDVCAAFDDSILRLGDKPETAHEAFLVMDSILQLIEKIKVVLDRGRLSRKPMYWSHRRTT
jgi:hypothetical protein